MIWYRQYRIVIQSRRRSATPAHLLHLLMIVPCLPGFRVDDHLVQDTWKCRRLWDAGEVWRGLVICVELFLGEGVGELLEVLVECK